MLCRSMRTESESLVRECKSNSRAGRFHRIDRVTSGRGFHGNRRKGRYARLGIEAPQGLL